MSNTKTINKRIIKPIDKLKDKKIALFVPCYIDQLYPQVGMATYHFLKNYIPHLEVPQGQTCCGQPMMNSGYFKNAIKVGCYLSEMFEGYHYVICPSGSCTSMMHHHLQDIIANSNKKSSSPKDLVKVKKVAKNFYELSAFITHHMKEAFSDFKHINFPHAVGIHHGCHGLRELNLASSSELMGPSYSYLHSILLASKKLKLVQLKRTDECCGFGGVFAVSQEAISCNMGNDRLDEHSSGGAEYITSTDMSCLMHLEGLANKQKRPLRCIHFSEILMTAY